MEIRNILIVEDDEYSIQMLEKLIFETTKNVRCYKAFNLEQAYMLLHKHTIDVFFIDIILDKINPLDVSGMNLAQELREIDKYRFTPIIFVTSVIDSKLYAYKRIHCYDYIEKPYHEKEVKSVLSQALHYKTEPKRDRTLYFKKDGILIAVDENDIILIKSKLRTVFIYTTYDEVTIPYKTCDYMLKVLDERMFIQCNKSTIVNIKYIGCIDKVNRYIELKDCLICDRISIGKTYLNQILERMNIC